MTEPESNSDPAAKVTEIHPRRRRPGIYILPSLFTTAGLFAGFFAIIQAIGGNFEKAAIAVFIAMVMDGLDGRVARLTHTESDFGAQYDSLVDMVAFGLAPALVMYVWALSGLGNLGWVAAFIYSAGAGLRLARFNIQVEFVDKRYFIGLPSPTAAAVVAGFIWLMDAAGLPGKEISILGMITTLAAGVLMVSNIRYRSFKDLDLKGKVPFFTILVVPLIFVAVFLYPPQVLFGAALIYTLSGPLQALWRAIGKRNDSAANPENK
jgi:CDP-diacylglycerol--serine O-phosphatidyltransferase